MQMKGETVFNKHKEPMVAVSRSDQNAQLEFYSMRTELFMDQNEHKCPALTSHTLAHLLHFFRW